MSNLVQLFREAVRKDDIEEVKTLLYIFPKFLDEIRASASSENPLLTACEHGSHQVAKQIASLWPELASLQNRYGYTPMHIASERGDKEMVKFLGELNPQSCLVQDNFSAIPLHRAAVRGNSDVIRELISICSESLGKRTSNQDTALHLAVKNSRFDAFQVLLDEIKIRSQEHLLNAENEDGNTVLQLATFNKFIEGQTAEACTANYQERVFNETDLILEGVSAHQQIAHCPIHQSLHLRTSTTTDSWNLKRWTIDTRNMLLVVAGTLAGVFFTVTSNLPDPLLKEVDVTGKTLHGKDVLSCGLPTAVYLLVFNSAGFMTTMTVIVVLGWPLRLRTIILFLVICACIVYIILVNEITPKFFVRFGKSSISSVGLMWSLVFALVCSGITILNLGKYIWTIWSFICGRGKKK